MKCTSNKQLTPRELRHQQQNRQTMKSVITFSVLLVILLVILGFLAYFFLIKGQKDAELVMPFDRNQVTLGLQREEGQTTNYAAPFTQDLCVTGADVPMEGLNLTSKGAGLFDLTNHQVMYSKDVHERLYPASLTKIMTALVALKYGNLDDVITVDESALDIDPESSVCYLQLGDKYTLRQLLYGLLIASGNDASVAIGEHVGGSVEEFVQMMNQEAYDIGATNTHFTNPHGLQDQEHYTTIYDVYLMFQEALKYDDFCDIINQKSYVAKFKLADDTEVERVWDATNHYFMKLAQAPEGVTVFGGKTGTTDEAGACLALMSKDPYGNPFISIIMGAETKDQLYIEMNDLLSKINK